jgi:hypothetical protein
VPKFFWHSGSARSVLRWAAFSAAGRSSTDPATADKAEKKKRKVKVRSGGASGLAGHGAIRDICAAVLHDPDL